MSRENTKKEILKNSNLLFSKHGFDGTSTQMIANAVGIKKPSIYYFFRNKESIYVELLTSTIEEVQKNFERDCDFETKIINLFKITKKSSPFIFSIQAISEDSLNNILKIYNDMSKTMLDILKKEKLYCTPKEAMTLILDITQNYGRRSAQGEKVMSPNKYAKILINLLKK